MTPPAGAGWPAGEVPPAGEAVGEVSPAAEAAGEGPPAAGEVVAIEDRVKTPGALVEGQVSGAGLRVAVVCSRFNGFVTEMLLAGAGAGLRGHGVEPADVSVVWVPGAFEIPLAAQRLAAGGRFDAVIALGAVIRGATSHYDLVAGQCAAGVQRVALDTGVPVAFGVLTTDTVDQAIERATTRAGAKEANKGFEAAATAIEMANLLRRL